MSMFFNQNKRKREHKIIIGDTDVALLCLAHQRRRRSFE